MQVQMFSPVNPRAKQWTQCLHRRHRNLWLSWPVKHHSVQVKVRRHKKRANISFCIFFLIITLFVLLSLLIEVAWAFLVLLFQEMSDISYVGQVNRQSLAQAPIIADNYCCELQLVKMVLLCIWCFNTEMVWMQNICLSIALFLAPS